MRDRLPLFAGLVALAIAIGVGSTLIADGIRNRNRNNVISVTGSAKRHIVSDYIVWDVSVTSQQPTTAKAVTEIDAWTQRIRRFLTSSGAKPGEVTEQPISTEALVAQGGKITGYKLTRSFQVRSPRVGEIASIAHRSSQLFAQGIPLNAQPPQYIYTKLSSLRPSLLTDATKDAQTRAKALVASTGGSVGHLVGVNVGVFQVTSPNSTDVTDYGVYDTSTLTKDVTAVVNATFALG